MNKWDFSLGPLVHTFSTAHLILEDAEKHIKSRKLRFLIFVIDIEDEEQNNVRPVLSILFSLHFCFIFFSHHKKMKKKMKLKPSFPPLKVFQLHFCFFLMMIIVIFTNPTANTFYKIHEDCRCRCMLCWHYINITVAMTRDRNNPPMKQAIHSTKKKASSILKSMLSMSFFHEIIHLNDLEEDALNKALLTYMDKRHWLSSWKQTFHDRHDFLAW